MSSSIVEILADLEELRTLRAAAQRPAVRALLESQIQSLEQRVKAVEATSASATPSAPTAAAAAAATTYQPIGRFGFEDGIDGYVHVLFYDNCLKGVGKAKESVKCSFTPSSFDLRIEGLPSSETGGGTDAAPKLSFRHRVLELEKDILPEQSKVVIKKNSVELLLKKAQSYDFWTQLAAKKPRAGAGAGDGGSKAKGAEADPSAGLMDLMRDMYQDGDAATRKLIAEAWSKSRDTTQQADAGAGGGLGGLGGFDDDFGMGPGAGAGAGKKKKKGALGANDADDFAI